MIKETTVYTLVCDMCYKDYLEGTESAGWNDKEFLLQCASQNKWIAVNEYNFCPDCYEYNDNDEPVILVK
jgi:hypothetical protein